jgi:hypothetical protein
MPDNLSVKDAAGATQTLAMKEYGSVKYPGVQGWSQAKVKSAASTNLTSVKASAGVLGGLVLCNNHASADRFIKFYNKASAPVIASDTARLVFTIAIPAGQVRQIDFPPGINFSTGIAYAITGAVGETDTTAIAVDDVTGFLAFL